MKLLQRFKEWFKDMMDEGDLINDMSRRGATIEEIREVLTERKRKKVE